MSEHPILAALAASSVLPVLVVPDPATADPLAQALLAGGLRVAEVTLRTDSALDVLARFARHDDLLVGAGTVLTAEQVDQAVQAGARFVVSPGFAPEVVRRCAELGILALPGVATASELMAALRSGCDVVKLFPAGPLGGLSYLSALAAAFPKVRFVPTGGIGQDDAPSYLAHRAVVAVGGSWMAPAPLLAAGDWDEVTRRATLAAASAPPPA